MGSFTQTMISVRYRGAQRRKYIWIDIAMSAVREVSSLDLPSSSSSCRPMLSSALLIERRLTALIGQLGRGFGYRDSGLVNNPINLPTQGQIGTGAAPLMCVNTRPIISSV